MGKVYIYSCDICGNESRDISRWVLSYVIPRGQGMGPAVVFCPAVTRAGVTKPNYLCSTECQIAFLKKHNNFKAETPATRRIKKSEIRGVSPVWDGQGDDL